MFRYAKKKREQVEKIGDESTKVVYTLGRSDWKNVTPRGSVWKNVTPKELKAYMVCQYIWESKKVLNFWYFWNKPGSFFIAQ